MTKRHFADQEMLRRESIPPNEHDLYIELPPAGQAHQFITEQAVERGLFAQSIRMAPGPYMLSFGAVPPLWGWENWQIVERAKAVI